MKCTSKKCRFSVLSGGTLQASLLTCSCRSKQIHGRDEGRQPQAYKILHLNCKHSMKYTQKNGHFSVLSEEGKNHTAFQSIWNVLPKKCAIKYWRWISLSHNWMIVRVGYAPREVCRDLPKSSERTKGAIRRSSDGAGTASGKNDSRHQTNS